MAAPLPITLSIRIAMAIIWLAAPTPETASSETELIIKVSTLPMSINRNNSRKIGQVSLIRLNS
ncbi:hypothetical protein D3C73_949570 [compost metagenome]